MVMSPLAEAEVFGGYINLTLPKVSFSGSSTTKSNLFAAPADSF